MASDKKPGKSPWVNRSPRIDLPPVEDRIFFISQLMREFLWERGKTAKELAEKWGLSVSTVEGYAAESWRQVRSEMADPENLRSELGVAVHKAMRMARDQGNVVGMVKAADTLGRLFGAHAVQKTEVSITDATPDNAKKLIAQLFSGNKSKPTDGSEGDK